MVKTIGSSNLEVEIADFVQQAKSYISSHQGTIEFDFTNQKSIVSHYLRSINAHKLVGIELLLGSLFDQIGFNLIQDPLFKDLVLYRLVYPKSKLKTTEYLYRYENKSYSEDAIYRYMDRLHCSQKELVQQISFEHTKKILGNDVGVVFYDVTTVYFEIDNEDELRKTGFSKEGKHQNPQIVLGLLVSKNGYPLAYEIFERNKFEGHTMLPVVDAFKHKYGLGQLIIIADSGLLSKANVEELQNKHYEFILGGRIRTEPKQIKDKILALELKHGQGAVIKKGKLKLIVTYSDQRAKKDMHNREKGLKRPEKQVRTGKLGKTNINNRGYNKYLKLDGEINVTIDYQKFEQDAKWDGLKGYITNARLSTEKVIENYRYLWQIEKAFRISKTDLKIRPIYHRLQRRIEAHICLSFVAYKIYKELERQLYLRKATISAEKAIEIAQSIFEIQLSIPEQHQAIKHNLILTDEQKLLAKLFDF